jgi:hypothetical protein
VARASIEAASTTTNDHKLGTTTRTGSKLPAQTTIETIDARTDTADIGETPSAAATAAAALIGAATTDATFFTSNNLPIAAQQIGAEPPS